MDAYSNYNIESDNEPNKVICFSDSNPQGVTIILTDNNEGKAVSFNLPRMEMIEALEYALQKIKARPLPL